MSSSLQNNITNLQELLDKVNALPEEVTLPELTNEGVADDLVSGKELIDGNGNIITGTFTIDNELSTQDSLISQIQEALQNKASTPAEDLDEELTTQENLIAELQEVLNTKAGGGSIETCTMTINFDGSGDPRYAWITGTQFIDNSITALSVVDDDDNSGTGVTSPYTLTNIVKNSALTISCGGHFSLDKVTCEGCELLYADRGVDTFSCKITESTAFITITNVY